MTHQPNGILDDGGDYVDDDGDDKEGCDILVIVVRHYNNLKSMERYIRVVGSTASC
jgi:hypothetical protein